MTEVEHVHVHDRDCWVSEPNEDFPACRGARLCRVTGVVSKFQPIHCQCASATAKYPCHYCVGRDC